MQKMEKEVSIVGKGAWKSTDINLEQKNKNGICNSWIPEVLTLVAQVFKACFHLKKQKVAGPAWKIARTRLHSAVSARFSNYAHKAHNAHRSSSVKFNPQRCKRGALENWGRNFIQPIVPSPSTEYNIFIICICLWPKCSVVVLLTCYTWLTSL